MLNMLYFVQHNIYSKALVAFFALQFSLLIQSRVTVGLEPIPAVTGRAGQGTPARTNTERRTATDIHTHAVGG